MERHGGSVPYGVFATDAFSNVRLSGKLTLSWGQRLQMRNWSRLRTGVVVLATRNGVRSTAKFQNCVFCNAVVRNPMVHVLSQCEFWNMRRQACLARAAIDDTSYSAISLGILKITYSDEIFFMFWNGFMKLFDELIRSSANVKSAALFTAIVGGVVKLQSHKLC